MSNGWRLPECTIKVHSTVVLEHNFPQSQSSALFLQKEGGNLRFELKRENGQFSVAWYEMLVSPSPLLGLTAV